MNCYHVREDGLRPVEEVDGRKANPAIRFCVVLLRGYKRFISPLFPPSCRFTPTCSQYAVDAVQMHGVLYGLFLAVWRLLRCHPFARGGYDPIK